MIGCFAKCGRAHYSDEPYTFGRRSARMVSTKLIRQEKDFASVIFKRPIEFWRNLRSQPQFEANGCYHGLRRRGNVDPDGAFRRLQRFELTVQQTWVYEVPRLIRQALLYLAFRARQIDITDSFRSEMGEIMLIGVLQGRAGKDDIFSTFAGILQDAG